MSRYLICHCYDVDDGTGEPIEMREPIARCDDFELARRWVENFDRCRVYAKPYNNLMCGRLAIYDTNRVPVLTEENMDENPWFKFPTSSNWGYVDVDDPRWKDRGTEGQQLVFPDEECPPVKDIIMDGFPYYTDRHAED